MATRTFSGTISTAFETAGNWDTLPIAGDNIIFAANCVLNGNDANIYGTVTYTGVAVSFNIQTYNFNSGVISLSGVDAANRATLTIGASSGTGLTCAGLITGSFTTFSRNANAKVNINTALFIDSGTVITANTGLLIINGDTSVLCNNTSAYWKTFTLNASCTMTMYGNCYMTNELSTSTVKNGTINVNGYALYIGCLHTGTFSIGANADVIGSGTIYSKIRDGATITMSKTGAFGFTGTEDITAELAYAHQIIIGDWRSSNVILRGSDLNLSYAITSGDLRIKDLTIINNLTGPTDLYLGLYGNNNLYIYGNVNCVGGTGTYDFNWIVGIYTPNIFIVGSSGTQSLDFGTLSIPDMIFECNASGATKTLSRNLIAKSIKITAGTFNDDANDMTALDGDFIVENGCTFTTAGVCYQIGTGNIKNASPINAFAELYFGYAGKINTLTNNVVTRKVHIGAGSVIGGYLLTITPTANDFLDLNSSSTIAVDFVFQLLDSVSYTQGALSHTMSLRTLYISILSGYEVTQTGAWNFPNSDIVITGGALNCNGQNLTIRDIIVGDGTEDVQMLFGSGNITFRNLTAVPGTNELQPESANFYPSGEINLTYIAWESDTEAIHCDGSGTNSITFSGNTIYEIICNKNSQSVSCIDVASLTKLTMLKGIFYFRRALTSTVQEIRGTGGNIYGDALLGGVQAVVNVVNPSTISGVYLRDLNGTKINMMNCKDNCTNLGNVNFNSFIFKDFIKLFN